MLESALRRPSRWETARVMQRLLSSLGVKLFLGIFALMVVVFAAFGYYGVQQSSQSWMQSVEQQAAQTSAVIERALRYGMLLNRKDDVYATMRDIAKEPGVNAIRIYDRRGKIMFSTLESEIGQRVDPDAEACVVCHDQGQRQVSAPNHEPHDLVFACRE